jgi:P4 family phage/plasmid primase-like protien
VKPAAPGVRDLEIAADLFESVRDRTPKPWEGRLEELLGGGHRIVERKADASCFSATRYRQGTTRGKAGVEAVTALVLDFDHVTRRNLARLLELLKGRASIIYTSFSHRLGGRDDLCFRLVLPCTRPMSPAEFGCAWEQTDAELGGLADPAAKDASRIWYLPSCPLERADEARLTWRDGDLLDIDEVLAREPPAEDQEAREGSEAGDPGGADLPSIPRGQRSSTLTSLAGAMRRRGASRRAIEAALVAENSERCEPPMATREARSIAASVCRYEPSSLMLDANLSDLGNAERLCAHAGRDLRYVHLSETWFCWMGRRWQKDETGEALRRTKATLREFARQARQIDDEDRRAALMRFALKSESARCVQATLRMATAELPVTPDELDRDPWLLNCANGTLDLRTGRHRPHRRGDLLTRLAPVAYDPKAACPLWESFLDRVLDGNGDLVRFLQRAVGYSLTGSTAEQVLFLLHGVGANGKSTFIETVRGLLGDYSTQADFTTFLRQQNEGVRNDVARLVGARFVSAVEAEGGRPLAEAMVKQLTGGDMITARFLFREFFEFKPVFKLWLAANSRPTVRGTDNGIWRRIRLIPFTVTIPQEERDPALGQKLAKELPGILAWAVRGCREWQEHGLGLPGDVKAALEDYRDSMDILGGFLAERCVVHDDAKVTSKDLYSSYTDWCEASGERAVTRRKMGLRLTERGFQRKRGTRGAHTWRGVGLRATEGTREDEE